MYQHPTVPTIFGEDELKQVWLTNGERIILMLLAKTFCETANEDWDPEDLVAGFRALYPDAPDEIVVQQRVDAAVKIILLKLEVTA